MTYLTNVKIAEETIPAPVSDGDPVLVNFDLYGKQRMAGFDESSESMQVTDIAPNAKQTTSSQIIDTTLDDSPTSVSQEISITGYDKIMIQYKVTKTNSPTSVEISFEISANDDDEYTDCPMHYNNSGTLTLATSTGALTATDENVYWLPEGIVGDKMQITATGTGTDATNYFAVDIWAHMKRG